jgi:hypothetical protein
MVHMGISCLIVVLSVRIFRLLDYSASADVHSIPRSGLDRSGIPRVQAAQGLRYGVVVAWAIRGNNWKTNTLVRVMKAF